MSLCGGEGGGGGEGLCEGGHYTELVIIERTWIVDIDISGVALGFSTREDTKFSEQEGRRDRVGF